MKRSYLNIGLSLALTIVVLLSDLGAAFARPRVRLNRSYAANARQMWITAASDPKAGRAIRGWINHQLRQQRRITRAIQMGRRPPGGNSNRIKNPPGYDAGHRIPGDHTTLRPELASMNRGRPGIARRVERRLGRRINRR